MTSFRDQPKSDAAPVVLLTVRCGRNLWRNGKHRGNLRHLLYRLDASVANERLATEQAVREVPRHHSDRQRPAVALLPARIWLAGPVLDGDLLLEHARDHLALRVSHLTLKAARSHPNDDAERPHALLRASDERELVPMQRHCGEKAMWDGRCSHMPVHQG